MASSGEGSRGGKVIRHTKSGYAVYASAAVTASGAGYAAHRVAPKVAVHAETRALKFGKQAGRLLGKVGTLSARATGFEKAGKLFNGSQAVDAKIRGGKFAYRAFHSSERAVQAEKAGFQAGKVATRLTRLAKILRKI
jgi:hypothetical protein